MLPLAWDSSHKPGTRVEHLKIRLPDKRNLSIMWLETVLIPLLPMGLTRFVLVFRYGIDNINKRVKDQPMNLKKIYMHCVYNIIFTIWILFCFKSRTNWIFNSWLIFFQDMILVWETKWFILWNVFKFIIIIIRNTLIEIYRKQKSRQFWLLLQVLK